MSATAITVNGIRPVMEDFQAMKRKQMSAAEQFVRRGGNLVATEAKRRGFASGSPPAPWQGPNYPTPTSYTSGGLKGSIRTERVVSTGLGGWMSQTGPTIVYGRRIELGYTGTGQWPYFTTRAFPFMAPALKRSLPGLEALWRELTTEGLVV